MDQQKKKTGIRLVFYFTGFLIMTLGVAVSIKSGLGVSPISSVPYTITVVFGMEMGLATMLFSVCAALLEIPILRKKYKLSNLLQISVSVVFGVFMTTCVNLVGVIPNPVNFAVRLILMLISTVIVAIGVFLYLSAGYIPLPTEGVLLAIAEVTNTKFASLKVIGDVTMVTVSLTTCLIALGTFGSIGLGTVVSALLVGTEVKLLTKLFGEKVKAAISA